MLLPNLNLLTAIVAGIVYFILGAVWYSPLLFAKPFMRYRGLTQEEIQRSGQPTDYLITLINAVIAALMLAVVIKLAGAASIIDGILIGLMVAIGFAVTSSLTYTIFSGPHKMLWVIYSGYQLVAFALMGIILTLWI